MDVAVLAGGMGPERKVSFSSGRAVEKALREGGFKAFLVEITDRGDFVVEGEVLPPYAAMGRLAERGVEAIFVALHGPFGEDGTIQGFLKTVKVPFTGPLTEAAALSMNKHAARLVFSYQGIPVPRGVFLPCGAALGKLPFAFPAVVKPCRLGSSVGVTMVRGETELRSSAGSVWSAGQDCLVEEYVEGVEFSCPVRDTRRGPEALPVVEIRPLGDSRFFDYRSKYGPGRAEEIVRTEKTGVFKRLRTMAVACHSLLNCRSFSRTDFILGKDGPVVLEINAIPGLTPNSLLPKSAAAAGISFAELVREAIRASLEETAEFQEKSEIGSM